MTVATPVTPILLKPADAAKLLCISPKTLWTMTKAGTIPHVPVGARSVRYRVADLEAYAAEAATQKQRRK